MTGDRRFWEDVEAGETAQAGPVAITRAAIVAFAEAYDPQPFHLDEATARGSPLGGLAASGWHTAALGMRLFYDGWVRHVASMGAPGIDELRWLRPVRPDDQLSAGITVEETRPSASRTDRGFARMLLELHNAAGDSVMTQRFSIILQRRGTRQSPGPMQAAAQRKASPPVPDADPMLAGFYEDLVLGTEIALGHQLFTPDLITGFAAAYDPQFFHLDASQAAQTHFGGLVASGWQTAACWMKHYVAARVRAGERRRLAGLAIAAAGPSPGFDALRWIQPVRAGETIAYTVTFTGKDEGRRPGWGMVTARGLGRRGDGENIFAFDGRMLWPTRPTGGQT